MSGGRRSSASMRRWFPTGVKERKTSTVTAPSSSFQVENRRHSKTELQPPSSTNPPPAVLDNVSEESVDVVLPPPMEQLPELPKQDSEQMADKPGDDQSPPQFIESRTSTPPLLTRPPVPAPVIHANEASGAIPLSIDVNYDKYMNISISPNSQGRVGGADESSLNCSVEELHLVDLPEVCGALDAREGLGQVPDLRGLPRGFQSGSLRLHGSVRVASQFIPHQETGGNFHEVTASLQRRLVKAISSHDDPQSSPDVLSGSCLSLGSSGLLFQKCHLMLFDRCLVIASPAMECRLEETRRSARDEAQKSIRLVCQFKYAISLNNTLLVVS
ncbi:hypothetical protein Ciccas_000415 [Cichlidogyrus casuarinus]|uniref:Uncharacterized protein n=1 Tax=Cichlidogyrus casuarinus TaxID=1844966 RepID=A0ABD2QMX3_9PLAT